MKGNNAQKHSRWNSSFGLACLVPPPPRHTSLQMVESAWTVFDSDLETGKRSEEPKIKRATFWDFKFTPIIASFTMLSQYGLHSIATFKTCLQFRFFCPGPLTLTWQKKAWRKKISAFFCGKHTLLLRTRCNWEAWYKKYRCSAFGGGEKTGGLSWFGQTWQPACKKEGVGMQNRRMKLMTEAEVKPRLLISEEWGYQHPLKSYLWCHCNSIASLCSCNTLCIIKSLEYRQIEKHEITALLQHLGTRQIWSYSETYSTNATIDACKAYEL